MGFNISDYILEHTRDTTAGLRDPMGVHVNNAGTRAVGYADYFNNLVGGYDFSPAYDLSTAVWDNAWKHVSESYPGGVWFDDTGLFMYTIGQQYDRIKQFACTVAWDQSTAGTQTNFDFLLGQGGGQGISGKPDGTELYVATHSGNSVVQVSLPTGNDFTGATLKYLDVGFASKGDIEISKDGTTLWVSQRYPFLVHQFTLSTAWDITTGTLDFTHDMGYDVRGMSIASNGTKLYTCDGTDNIYQYGYTPPIEAQAEFEFTATADGFFPYPNPANISFTATASGEIKVFDSAYFNFLYAIQTVQAERSFNFLYEIEQAPAPAQIIKRVNA